MSSQQTDRFCYIRRTNHQGWVRARLHHKEALESFLNTPYNLNDPYPIEISVPHGDGGNFIAHFTHVLESDNQHTQNSLCYYVDENNQHVDIMICEPAYAAYINRIVDF